MILLHRWKFFSKKGHNLNLERIPKIIVEINDTQGNGALFQPVTDNLGNLIALEVVEPGIGFNDGFTNIDIIDENGTVYHLPYTAFTFDANGGFASVNIGSPPPGAFSYPAFTYEGNLFFEKISQGLIENEHIFIIEEVVDSTTNKKQYVYPRFNGANAKILCQWSQNPTLPQDKEAIFLFDVDTTTTSIPFIQKIESQEFNLANGSTDSFTNGAKYSRYIPVTQTNSIQINLGTSYDSEGIFERKLELYDLTTSTPVLLAEIYLRSEIIPEDERFLTILDNLGQKISHEEEFIFRDSDINEALPNYDLLNKKRKEFILEHANIIPYIGSYKAVFNVLNWLGYHDLRLKEYWLNVQESSSNYNKYKPVEIQLGLKHDTKKSQSSFSLPSNFYKKTNLFALYYDLNRVTSQIDEFGLPITEDAFIFTIEEVLIKLFALKKYLKNKFLPLNARIIDIVGEGVYFERYRINSWQDGTRIFDIRPTRQAKFTRSPHVSTIVDLREFNNYDYFKPAKLKAYLNSTGGIGIVIEDGGYGYVGNLSIIFDGGAPLIPAQASPIVNDGVIVGVNLIDPGSGYISPPSVSVWPSPTNPDYQSTLISYIKNRLLAFHENINDFQNLPDAPGLPVGAPVLLKTTSFDITWDELQFPWDSFYYDFRPAIVEAILGSGSAAGTLIGFNIIDPGQGYIVPPTVTLIGGSPTQPAILGSVTLYGGSLIGINILNPGSGYISKPTVVLNGGAPVSFLNTWDTLGIGEFYEIEWIVKGPNQYIYTKRDRVDLLKEHAILVPYQGDYDVELRLYDTDNNYVNEIRQKCFSAVLPEVNFTAFTRFTESRDEWNEMKMSWDQANFMWINPVSHKTTWNDMDLTWNDFEMSTYISQEEKRFPPILEFEVLRISETHRYLGNLIEVNPNTSSIKIKNASSRPPVNPGDYLYFKRDAQIFRTSVIGVNYGFSVAKIQLLNPGSNYTLEHDYLTGVSTYSRPSVSLPPPSSGLPAQAIAILNASLTGVGITYQGSNLVDAIDNQGNILAALPITMSGSTAEYNFLCSQPEDPNGIPASGKVIVETTAWSVQSVTILNPGSGYDNVPIFKILDANSNLVVSSTGDNPTFKLTIAGPLKEIQVVSPGSGYNIPPPVSISAPLAPGTPASAVSILDLTNNLTEITVSNLPSGLNSIWDVLREIGQTILLAGDHVYDSVTNPSGLKVGDWIKLRSLKPVPQISRLAILDRIYNGFGEVVGIKIAGDYTNQLRKGEKIRIYRHRKLVYGQGGLNPNEFNFDVTNKTLTIYNPTFDPSQEIIPGFHIITLTNVDNTVTPAISTYTQRFLVQRIIKTGNDYVLDIIPLDGDIGQINTYTLPSLTSLEYYYWEFPGVVVSFTSNGLETEIILNFNDWPEHKNFDPLTDPWYFDYGTVSGDWSMLVTQIGHEGPNTLITVDDPNSELWRSSTSYLLSWRTFDEDYAERRFGTETLIWDNFDEIIWDDTCRLTWDLLDYHDYSYCGFRIFQVGVNGRIQWNEEPPFEFQGITGSMTSQQKLIQAVIELNATENPGLSRFTYTLMPNSTNPTYIMARAKNPGGENIGYLRFGNGVVGEYTADLTLSHTFPLNHTDNPLWLSGYYGPNNKPANWNSLIRTYREWGIDPAGNPGWYPSVTLPTVYNSDQRKWESQRIPYLRAVSGAFTWDETLVSTSKIQVPVYTLVFFTASGCKIRGKTQYLWRIYDHQSGKILVEVIQPYLIWLFSRLGEFDIELSIIDTYGNKKTQRRQGFVKTYQPSFVETRVTTLI